MQITPRSRLRLRAQNLAFLVLFGTAIGLLAWLSTRYVVYADWTSGARNTLSAASRELLMRLPGPVRITAFARDNPALRGGIETLVARYQRYKPDIGLDFVNPDTAPERTRALGITRDGELYLEYAGRSERLQALGEQDLTNTLQRLSRRERRVAAFLAGHGERNPSGQANHDLGSFGRELERTGIEVRELNLAREPHIAEDTAVLVIASPQTALLPGEVGLIEEYLDRGGNPLWLAEPNEERGLGRLGEALGVRVLPGVIVDANTPLFGIDNPAFVLVADYGPHPITADLDAVTLFPMAAALEARAVEGWEPATLFTSQPRTWTETGPLSGEIRFDPDSDERAGPLTLGVALSRPLPATQSGPENPDAPRQRAVVMGDGDFLSNAYLGNGGNLKLGLNLVNWLSQDDALIAIHVRAAPDQTLELSRAALLAIGAGTLLALPAALLSAGLLIGWRRRRR